MKEYLPKGKKATMADAISRQGQYYSARPDRSARRTEVKRSDNMKLWRGYRQFL